MKRAPSTPPDLPGYQPISHIGSGGFADVFLYSQDLPRRRVAVKVLVADAVTEDVTARFIAEANAMALLSAHPSIVTIYFAGVAPDGRPCMVMEYCPRPNLAVRYRRETIPVAEALRIGVRLASAVETAHRAGILHRDIKPANVLVTEYGWPALTDFGISAQVDTVGVSEALSLPWSAPELFAPTPHADVRTDVYALGATVYALLAGRSPFEVPGASNSATALMERIEREPVPPIGRRDVPHMLEQVLARAMHKRPEARYRSAYDFARSLNEVEQALGLNVTELDVMDNVAVSAASVVDEDATRLHKVTTISDDTEPRAGTQGSAGTLTGSSTGPYVEADPQRRTGRIVLGIGLLLIIAAVVIAAVLLGNPRRDVDRPPPPPGSSIVNVPVTPPPPVGLECSLDEARTTLTCTWQAPAGVGDDVAYSWNVLNAPERTTVEEPTLTVTVPRVAADDQVCAEVRTIVGSRASTAATACAR